MSYGDREVDSASRTQTWNLDALGNWEGLNQTGGGSNQTRDHDQQNRIESITGMTAPLWDSNGNMTRDQTGITISYDAWDRLRNYSASNPTTYEYDALGRRVEEDVTITGFTESVTDTDFYYTAQWQVVEERVDEAIKQQYVWSARYVDAMVLRDRDADGNSGNGLEQRHYVQSDANFNITALVNTSGAVVERYVYDAYGTRSTKDANWNSRFAQGLYGFRYGHQGLSYDFDTGLYDNRMRLYSPALGRFVQQDPIRYVDGMNLYELERSRPTTLLDPSGLLAPTPVVVAGGATVGGVAAAGAFVVAAPVGGYYIGTKMADPIAKWWHPDPCYPPFIDLAPTPTDPPPDDPPPPPRPPYKPPELEKCEAKCWAKYESDASRCYGTFWPDDRRGYALCMDRAYWSRTRCLTDCRAKYR